MVIYLSIIAKCCTFEVKGFTTDFKQTTFHLIMQTKRRHGVGVKGMWGSPVSLSAVEFRNSRMKRYEFYSMEMQSKFICVLPTSL